MTMSEAQLLEEELQQSVRVAESLDADGDEDMPDAYLTGVSRDEDGHFDGDGVDGEDLEDEEDAEGEEDDIDREDGSEDGSADEDAEHEDYDEDAEHEEDDVDPLSVPSRGSRTRSRDLVKQREEDEEDGDDEAVGAVKLKPGETDDEESDAASFHSGGESDEDESETEDDWEALQPEKEEDDDDESETGDNDLCMFCKQDENHDPAEEFEAYLSCASCGENSHQQCAREANALQSPVEDPTQWRCPDCGPIDDETQQSDNQEEEEGDEEEAEQETNGNADEPSPSSSRSGRNSLRESVQKVARELLPAQRGAKPNAHSIYNQLVLDDDPMDGSRNLRKRKASTTEPEEHVMSLRKRRKSTLDPHSNEATNGTIESAGPRSTRPLRLKLAPQASAEVIKSTRNSLLVTFTAKPAVLRKIFSKKPKGLKKRRGRRAGGGRRGSTARARRGTATDDVAALPPLTAPFVSTSYSQPFYSFYDKEADEFKGKPYGGVLTEAEADTSRTLPTSEDRRRFDEAKQQAEEAWRERLLAMQAEAEIPVRKPARKVSGPASQIECIEFGGWEIDTWYAAPYPEEYSRNRVLYICEFCLKYMNSDYVAWRHKLKCPAKHPPGDEIYRHGSVSVFEVDGRKNPVYCQNLCLLAKLFLGSKTLYYDVEPFLFYILCEYDDLGYHFVGYFSKEKRESSQNNVSCILTLPIHQRKGYGNLLIDFSYLLTRVEQKTGSPEKPLSDMGLVSYRSYWRLIICRYFLQHISADRSQTRGLSIKNISEDTGLTADDVVSALEALRFFVRDPQTGLYALRVDFEYCREYVAKWESKNYVQLKPSALTWTPYVMGRSYPSNFELGPAINVLAPREEDDKPPHSVTVVETTEDTVMTNGHDKVGGLDNEAREEPHAGAGVTILESTEPNEGAPVLVKDAHQPEDPAPADNAQRNGVAHAVASHPSDSRNGVTTTPADDASNDSGDWVSAYKEIPPTRFEVFPPATNARLARARSTVARAPAVRIAGSARRPAARRRTSGIKRSAGPKPRSATKRKTGGTGRGPGRWPKGTKKSDYGNADSGPGLPPGWIEKKAVSVATASPAGSVKRRGGSKNGSQPSRGEEEDGGDAVEVSTPKRATTGGGKGRSTPRSAKGKDDDDSIELVQGDLEMAEDEDEDA